jgi:hypothetical protein
MAASICDVGFTPESGHQLASRQPGGHIRHHGFLSPSLIFACPKEAKA